MKSHYRDNKAIEKLRINLDHTIQQTILKPKSITIYLKKNFKTFIIFK